VVDEAGQAMEPEVVAVLAPLHIPQVCLLVCKFDTLAYENNIFDTFAYYKIPLHMKLFDAFA